MNEINFIVNGEIKGKGRPRFSKVGNFVRTYTDEKTISYENKVLMCYKEAVKGSEYETNIMFPKGTMVSICVFCYFKLRKTDYCKKGLNKSGKEKMDRLYCDKKPDFDNVVKSVLDGLNGVCYEDDSQVVLLYGYKKYTEQQERLEISIKKI